MSMTPERRFLGIDATKPDDRALLALPVGEPLKSGQIEAALERRADEIARHPLAGSIEAKRLQKLLELSADRLQAELALTGKGPLHPIAARRAAARMQAMPTATAIKKTSVVAPTAISKPGIGLSAEDLTDFDRVALAILVVSGGWNATCAKRLAIIAEDYGVSVSHLERVVLGLTAFLSQGDGMRSAMGDVGESARTTWMAAPHTMSRADVAEGAVERVFTRINDVLRDEVGSGSAKSQIRLTVIFACFALAWIGALGYLFFWNDNAAVSGDGETKAPLVADTGDSAKNAASAPRGDVDANGKSVAPIAALAAPAKFPRPPGFVATSTPAAVAESASAAATWLVDLDESARALTAAKGRVDGSSESTRALELLGKALSRAADAWPASGGYRADTVQAFGAVARSAHGADSLRLVMQSVPGSSSDLAQRAVPAWQREWRLAFGAGCLAAVALDASQSPELAAAAREEMRQRLVAIPRGQVDDPFGVAAIESLSAAAPRLAEQVVFGSSTLEDVARWNEAVFAASPTPKLRIRALVAAIDAVLRAPGALDQPGPIVDTLAFFIRALDFTGRGAEADSVRNALSAWILDKNIPPTRIWVFTSLLDADLGVAWYGPDLVLATNADETARATLAERVDKAFPRVTSTSAGEAVYVDESQMEIWKTGLEKIVALPSSNEAERLRNTAAGLAFARVVRGFERSDEKMAKSGAAQSTELIEREGKEWTASPSGERAGVASSGILDGSFVAEWTTKRDTPSRLDAIRMLRSRPSAGDLGPIDARLAVVEALRSNQPELRDELCKVLIDRYANGREVLRALLDALADGSGSDSTRTFVGAISGSTVAGRDWISEGRRALLEKIYQMDESAENAIDSACAEIATQAAALAVAYGKSGGKFDAASVFATRPDRAISVLGDAMRAEAATRFLAEPFPSSVDEIERQRNARRSLAASVTQRMAAETPALVEYAAMLVASRQPSLQSTLGEIVAGARRARASAQSASEQVASDVNAMLNILGKGLAPRATERSG